MTRSEEKRAKVQRHQWKKVVKRRESEKTIDIAELRMI